MRLRPYLDVLFLMYCRFISWLINKFQRGEKVNWWSQIMWRELHLLTNYCNHDQLINMHKNWNKVTFRISKCPSHEKYNWPPWTPQESTIQDNKQISLSLNSSVMELTINDSARCLRALKQRGTARVQSQTALRCTFTVNVHSLLITSRWLETD